jgi:Tfp pilus assembly protein PilN
MSGTGMHLDFVHPRRPASWGGWVLLGFGVLLLGSSLAWQRLVLEPRLVAAEGEWRRLQAEFAAREPAGIRLNDEQLAAEWTRAARVAEELAAPWAPLLAMLESAADQPVALLSLEPDAARQELVLTGEARNFAALLDYYRYLQQQRTLSAVALQTHQVNRQDRDKPVRFRITARWERTP